MAYVVTEDCISCKYTDCAAVCPVDCFHHGELMLVIDPVACIDCAVCEPACPAEAIKPDYHPDGGKWKEHNSKYSAVWPVIRGKSAPLPDADAHKGEKGKYEKYFREARGT